MEFIFYYRIVEFILDRLFIFIYQREKLWGHLGSFESLSGQISSMAEISQIIRQVDSHFSQKYHFRGHSSSL